MSILVLIVTYNSEIEFVKSNIQSFRDYPVLIVDNDSGNIEDLETNTKEYKNLKIIRNKKNLGIAHALNQGLDYAKQNSYQYLLTMDQDSNFRSGIEALLRGFEFDNRIAIVCPSIFDINSQELDLADSEFQELFVAITSGCLCKVESLLYVGGFDDKLFIDYVDFEICLRLQKNGFKVLRSREAVMNHSLGRSVIYRFLGIKFVSTNHNPFRRYYNARNRVYIARKYFRLFPNFVLANLMSFFKTQFIIIFKEKNRIAKIKATCKGIWEGLNLK